MKPLAAILLWLSMATMIVANNALGDTLIALESGPLVAEIYKAVVPLPYILLCAWVYARRQARAGWFADSLAVGLLWAVTTVVADVLLARFAIDQSWRGALLHYRFWDGYWFALVPLAQLVAPALLAGWMARRESGTDPQAGTGP